MGTEGLEIESDDEVVDFCMQYRIPKIEGIDKCKNLKVSKDIFKIFRNLIYAKISSNISMALKKIQNLKS